jgi:Amidase
VIETHLRRINAVNPALNAIVIRLDEQTLGAADVADCVVAAGDRFPPLHGVPFTIKECFDLAGTPITAGWKALANEYPSRDAPDVAAADLGPASGRARLSYRMAEQLFKRYSGGKTLHQLRHSRLTHLGEANVSAPLLMAISGHMRLATLQRYVTPSKAAVAALMAASDPDRRGR